MRASTLVEVDHTLDVDAVWVASHLAMLLEWQDRPTIYPLTTFGLCHTIPCFLDVDATTCPEVTVKTDLAMPSELRCDDLT
ncbi:hypothetical protein BHM03_00056151 [Ensete ventricosum]|nr:hypothetical protein BHM03_00056151 [Ensete ventricosum]